MNPLVRPHHDGSGVYVSDPYPGLGDAVTLFVRVPHAAGVSRVLLRTTPDGEAEYADAVVDRRVGSKTWWRADPRIHNPEMGYRFLLDGGTYGYRWLHQGGVVEHDPPDATDFRLTAHAPPPAWAADAVFYQVFPDRFARDGSTVPRWPAWAGRPNGTTRCDTTTTSQRSSCTGGTSTASGRGWTTSWTSTSRASG